MESIIPDNAKNRIRNKGQQLQERAASAVDTATTRAGEGIEATASALNTGSEKVTTTLETAGAYLQNNKPGDMIGDVGGFMQKHPKTTLAVGFGVGFLIARALSRR